MRGWHPDIAFVWHELLDDNEQSLPGLTQLSLPKEKSPRCVRGVLGDVTPRAGRPRRAARGRGRWRPRAGR